jgi:hypothetical protein
VSALRFFRTYVAMVTVKFGVKRPTSLPTHPPPRPPAAKPTYLPTYPPTYLPTTTYLPTYHYLPTYLPLPTYLLDSYSPLSCSLCLFARRRIAAPRREKGRCCARRHGDADVEAGHAGAHASGRELNGSERRRAGFLKLVTAQT